jgi:hypothetical protein
MKSETHRTATAPHSNEISPLPRRTATIKKNLPLPRRHRDGIKIQSREYSPP